VSVGVVLMNHSGSFAILRNALFSIVPDILSNPKARRDYHVLETYEAGLVLRGT